MVANTTGMSAEPRRQKTLEESEQQQVHESDRDVSDALMLLFRLPDEALASIHESAKSLKVNFAEAALHTGLVTQHELDQALEYVRRQERNAGRGIVEEALR